MRTEGDLQTVGQIVQADYRTADVFRQYGIDYCCKGHLSLQQACAEQHVSTTELMMRLDDVVRTSTIPRNASVPDWKTDFLIDYIVNIHHVYLEGVLDPLDTGIDRICKSHSDMTRAFKKIQLVFRELRRFLEKENRVQEETIFPYIKQIDNAYRRKESYGPLLARTIGKPLRKLADENKRVAELLRQLRLVTHNYSAMAEGCADIHATMQRLKELDNDLVQHKHLENNILLPKVANMENALLEAQM